MIVLERQRKTLIYTIERSKVENNVDLFDTLTTFSSRIGFAYVYPFFMNRPYVLELIDFAPWINLKKSNKNEYEIRDVEKNCPWIEKYFFCPGLEGCFRNINEKKGSVLFQRFFVQIKLLFISPPIDTFF